MLADSTRDTSEIAAARGPISLHQEDHKLIFLFADDPAVVEFNINLLEGFGYKVRVSKDPRSISGGALKLGPSALVINNRDPKIVETTLSALRRLNESGRLTCPAIFVGDFHDLSTRLAAVRGGCTAFMDRPVNPMLLIETLDQLVEDPTADPLKVLIVDDSETAGRFHATCLEEAGMIVRNLFDPMEGASVIRSFQPELILMDIVMPNCSGPELAAVVRQERANDDIPIVYLSGAANFNDQLRALEQGGDGFLTKPIEPQHLVRAVTIRANRFRKLRRLIVHDSLTGLLNHSVMNASVPDEIERSRRGAYNLSFAAFDLDLFKLVNDTYGHAVGDMVIKTFARLLRRRFRQTDHLGRMGGEEFAALLPGVNAKQAMDLVEDVRREFASIEMVADNEVFNATFSCGIADTRSFDTVSDLMAAADLALYKSKHEGRNRITTA